MDTTTAELASRSYRIGRDVDRGMPTYAFTLKREEDGSLDLLNVQDNPTERERKILLDHFSTPLLGRSGRSDGDTQIETVVTLQPDTPEHFVAAVHRIPYPFILLPSKG